MARYGSHFASTPQSQPLPGKAMIPNAAGGYVYEIDDWQRLRRFLILGTDGGSYYEPERKLTLENAEVIRRCMAEDYRRTVDLIVEVSDRGLAPKNDPAVFALACATKFGPSPESRNFAYKALPKVCRIGTHLFQFAQARKDIGAGWTNGSRKAVANWYLNRPPESLITQALKYAQRDGVSHRDLLRLSHATPPVGPWQSARGKIFSAIVHPDGGPQYGPSKGAKDHQSFSPRNIGAGWEGLRGYPLVDGYLKIKTALSVSDAAKIIIDHELPRELIPTEFLKHAEVWAALLPHMGIGALTRNLGNLSKCGLLAPLSETAKWVSARFADEADIKKSRLHPFAILVAAKVYASGKSVKGSGVWTVVPQVVTALDSAFDLAFHNVEPTGKNFLLGVDVSASMGGGYSLRGAMVMTPAEAAAAMALVTARVEPNHYIMGFSTQFADLGINAKDTLPTVLQKTRDRNFGGTDTSVAIKWALDNKVKADVIEILTDNETWAGATHASQSLVDYRRKMGIPTKLAVVAFTGTNRSVADYQDPGSMDFVGMDASLPQALAAFVTE